MPPSTTRPCDRPDSCGRSAAALTHLGLRALPRCGLLDERVLDENSMATSLTTAQADICFRKVLPKGQRSLSFELFCTGLLPELARKKATSAEALVQAKELQQVDVRLQHHFQTEAVRVLDALAHLGLG